MNIVVTGGCGYIGCHLVDILLSSKKLNVKVIDKGSFGFNSLKNHFNNPRFELVKGDILHIDTLSSVIKDCDVVIHLAGIVGDPACSKDPELTWLINVESSNVLVDLCNYYKVKRLIFASSCSVYGWAPSYIMINEGSYVNPLSEYAKSKLESEKIFFSNLESTIPTSLRFGTIFGFSRRMRFDLVVNLFTVQAIKEKIINIFGGGSQKRAFLHCLDAARSITSVLFSEEKLVNREVFNVVGENKNIKEVAEIISEEIPGTNLNLVEQKEDDRSYQVCGIKSKWLLEYQPLISLREGIQEMIPQLKKNFSDWKTNSKYHNVMR